MATKLLATSDSLQVQEIKLVNCFKYAKCFYIYKGKPYMHQIRHERKANI